MLSSRPEAYSHLAVTAAFRFLAGGPGCGYDNEFADGYEGSRKIAWLAALVTIDQFVAAQRCIM